MAAAARAAVRSLRPRGTGRSRRPTRPSWSRRSTRWRRVWCWSRTSADFVWRSVACLMPCSLLRRPRCALAALAMFSTAPTPCSTKLDAASICNGDDPTLQRPTPEPPPTLTPCSRPTLSTKHDFARYTISRDPVNSYLPVVVARPAAKAIFPCLCANMRRAPFPNSGRD